MASIKVFMTNEDKPKKIIGTPEVPIKMSKKVSNKDGTVIYFIQKTWGIKNGLMHVMNFKTLHPLNDKFCEIKIEINRI